MGIYKLNQWYKLQAYYRKHWRTSRKNRPWFDKNWPKMVNFSLMLVNLKTIRITFGETIVNYLVSEYLFFEDGSAPARPPSMSGKPLDNGYGPGNNNKQQKNLNFSVWGSGSGSGSGGPRPVWMYFHFFFAVLDFCELLKNQIFNRAGCRRMFEHIL